MAKNFSVTAHLPGSVEITRRTSQNSLALDIKDGSSKLGTLVVGVGTIEWWPKSNKVNVHRGNWNDFAAMMEQHFPARRSSR
ncbi:MAG: hypothetical protein M3Y27_29155 [Acidobacteriota bacterium]|nr:hypothetical protein [Acidobacteriota bacterium]